MFYNERCKKFHKNQFFSNIFTFLSVTFQNFQDNLRNLANFGKFSFFTLSNNYSFFFNKDYAFCTINLFIRPKNCVQSIFYNERCKKFRKNQIFSKIFTLKIYLFEIFPKIAFKKLVFFHFLIKILH